MRAWHLEGCLPELCGRGRPHDNQPGGRRYQALPTPNAEFARCRLRGRAILEPPQCASRIPGVNLGSVPPPPPGGGIGKILHRKRLPARIFCKISALNNLSLKILKRRNLCRHVWNRVVLVSVYPVRPLWRPAAQKTPFPNRLPCFQCSELREKTGKGVIAASD
jgi:hypothetical protein